MPPIMSLTNAANLRQGAFSGPVHYVSRASILSSQLIYSSKCFSHPRCTSRVRFFRPEPESNRSTRGSAIVTANYLVTLRFKVLAHVPIKECISDQSAHLHRMQCGDVRDRNPERLSQYGWSTIHLVLASLNFMRLVILSYLS